MKISWEIQSMSRMDLLLMRHGYDDHSYIDGLNDTGLTAEGIRNAKVAIQQCVPDLAREFEAGLSLRVSTKRRAVETADLLSEEMDRHSIEYDVFPDSRLCELYQGRMIGLVGKNHAERVRMLELGWEIFDNERRAGNNNYKYGAPEYSQPRYDEFNKFVAPPYGESQNELSSRVESGFLSAVAGAAPTGRTPLFVVHRGTIREILNIASAHNDGRYSIGQESSVEMAGWKYCEMFRTSLDDIHFSLGALGRTVHGRSSS